MEEGMMKHSSVPAENHMNHSKRQKDMTLRNESPRLEDYWRRAVGSKAAEPKWKSCSVVDVSGDKNNV